MVSLVDAYACDLTRAPAPIRIPVLKLGGGPVLLHSMAWPTCADCGQKMDFLAQIPLRQPLRFSTAYEMAYVFMCPEALDASRWLTCSTWSASGGANAVVMQTASDGVVLSGAQPAYPDYHASLRFVGEPQIDTTDYRLDESLHSMIWQSTKIGGVPLWLQSNETPTCPSCRGPTKFVAQLDAALDGPLPADPSNWDDSKYQRLKFGSTGLGYLFVCGNDCGPCGAAFLWQCT